MSADIYANMRLTAWREALRVFAIQTVVVLVVVAISAVIWGRQSGLGMLIGAAIALLANAYLVISLLLRPMPLKIGSVMFSWLVRVVLFVGLLWIAMRAKIVPPLSLIAGMFSVIVSHWMVVTFWLSGRR